MEFRTLTGSDLGSLLELYQQLDPKDGLSAEVCEGRTGRSFRPATR